MTDNRTTELREKLDELGIEHFDYDKGGRTQTQWEAPDGKRHFTYETSDNPAKTARLVVAWHPTPEQAIAATMGNRPTKSGRGYYTDRDGEGTHIMCDDCGGYIGTVEEITATLGSGECEMEHDGEIVATALKLSVWFCSECGSPTYNDMKPFYCQYCGAKVVDR